MRPTLGRIVLYCMSRQAAEAINWANPCNEGETGYTFPMMITTVNSIDGTVNGLVFATGVHYVSDVPESSDSRHEVGTWQWPTHDEANVDSLMIDAARDEPPHL